LVIHFNAVKQESLHPKGSRSDRKIDGGIEMSNRISTSGQGEMTETHGVLPVPQLAKQFSLINKLAENFVLQENEIIFGKVKVMKPKAYEQIKEIILPTVYSLAEVKSVVKGGKSKFDSIRTSIQTYECKQDKA
jgi:hypothetical protein